MDELAVRTAAEGLKRFQTSIVLRTADEPKSVIRQAIARDPKIEYYLRAYSILGTGGRYEIKPKYEHTDTERSDIQIVTSPEECEKLICRYVGKYRKELIVLSVGKTDLRGAMEAFHEKDASFYPNLTQTQSVSYSLPSGNTAVEYSFEYRIGQVKLALMEQEVADEVRRIARLLFKPDMPDAVRIYLAHNYLATTVEYVNDDDNRLDLSYTQSAYGALIRKQCVCQGFSEAFKRLMDAAGVECAVIYGQAVGSSVLHSWNLVKPGKDSGYYHIDVTWDAAGVKPGYLYFCRNDAYFVGKRTWNKAYNPPCSGAYPALSTARRYVRLNRDRLLAAGIDPKILDC